MKNAKAKLTRETAAARGWKPVERDSMPAAVATDLLCSLERMTRPEANGYREARVSVWCSDQEPKPREDKMGRRYSQATLAQLIKWSRRACKRRRGLQHKYVLAVALPEETPVQALTKNRLVAALDFAAGLVDQVIDGTQDEIVGRFTNMPGDKVIITEE